MKSNDLKIQSQENEYRLPIHWLHKKSALRIHNEKIKIISELIKKYTSNKMLNVLDVGCGDGRNTHDIKLYFNDNISIQGIDFSDRAISFAKLMAPNIEFNVAQGADMEFKESSFDLIISIEVIEHIPIGEEISFLNEINRVLKPGGLLLLTTPSINRKVPLKHFQHFTKTKLVDLLKKADFTHLETIGFGWWPPENLEKIYRFIITLPSLWRIHSFLGTLKLKHEKSDDLILIAQKNE